MILMCGGQKTRLTLGSGLFLAARKSLKNREIS